MKSINWKMLKHQEVDAPNETGWHKWGPAVLAAIAVAVFFYLRMRNLGHPLNFDEARFALYCRSFVNGMDDFWSKSINMHPPLYLWLCAYLGKGYGSGAVTYEVISLVFSFGTLLITGRIGWSLFGRWTGAMSMFFLAVLPASSVFDVWIKEDAAAVFFITLTIYLFARKKYYWSGLALGMGMLSKEIAIFALLTIGLYSLVCWEKDKVLGVVKAGLIGGAVSFWWYLFMSNSEGNFAKFFLGSSNEYINWSQPWHYYFSGLPDDLGWVILGALLAGLLFCVYRCIQGKRIYALPIVWFVPVYLVLSFSFGKPYWMVTSALPAAALLAAIGTVEAVKWLGEHIHRAGLARACQALLAGGLMIAALANAVLTSAADYNISRHSTYWPGTVQVQQDAELIKQNLEQDDTLFLINNPGDLMNPTFIYYLGPVMIDVGAAWMVKAPDYLANYVKSIGSDWIYLGEVYGYDMPPEDIKASIEERLPVKSSYYDDFSLIFELDW